MRRLISVFSSLFLVSSAFAAPAPSAPPVHADNPVARTEHEAMLDLVRESEATHVAVRSGPWSQPGTWKQNAVPAAGATVLIPHDVAVTVDAVMVAALRGVRVEGTLRWDTERDACLTVDTLLVVPGAHLEMGTVQHPIAAGARARIVFADGGPIDTVRDPMIMGRGLISHGTVRICGSEITPFSALARAARQGDRSLMLTHPPQNWKKGDRLVLPAVRVGEADEDLTVLDVRGSDVAVAPLANDHVPPADDLLVYVANLTRNVVLESQNKTDNTRRGHVMFMHNGDVDVRFAAFDGLGRTDKSTRIVDAQLDAAGRLVAGTGTNPRGRYAVHFHRTGTLPGKPTAIVAGCAVTDSPGWGFVNHSSHVDFDGNVAFNVLGSAFVTEAGDEVGVFRRNFAIRSKGSGEDEDDRKKLQDFGHEGDGFWFQGGGITVEDNVASGQRSSGFIFFTEGLKEDGLGAARFAVANFWRPDLAATVPHVDHKDPKLVGDADTVPVIFVPVKSFKRNTAFACGTGFTARFMQPRPNRSAYEDGIVWNSNHGVRIRYTSHLDLRNLRLVGNPHSKNGFASITGTLEGDQDIRYENLRVEGWPLGIYVPEVGHHVIAGGYYNNVRSIMVPSPMARGRHIEITGDIKFGNMDPGALGGRPQYDIDLDARFSPMLDNGGGYRDPNVLFAADIVRIDLAEHPSKQLYFFEQEANYVPFPRNTSMRNVKQMGKTVGAVPEEILDKTNRQMAEKYGLAIGGALVPPGAATDPRIHALIGPASGYSDELQVAAVRTTQAHD
jgi:hypothetical protein